MTVAVFIGFFRGAALNCTSTGRTWLMDEVFSWVTYMMLLARHVT